jgi:2-keto-4-pentenoate hydratase/2-oxohepta-3-ene-1,7-dioic acid hydratase in catechol pathway
VQVLAPLRRPGKVVCVGLNYRDHCREVGLAEPHGTGAFQRPPRFLADGDVMEAWIAQIGSLRNPVSGSAMPLTAGHRSAPVG